MDEYYNELNNAEEPKKPLKYYNLRDKPGNDKKIH